MKRVITLLLAALLLTAVFAACSQETFEDLSATQLLDLGERFLLEGNYEQAMIHFTRLIEIDPMNPQGHIGLARAYLGLGNPARAREVLEQSREQVPDDPEIGDMLDELDEAEREVRRETLEVEARQVLEDLAELDEEAFREKLEIGELADIINEFSQFTEFPLIFETERGEFGIHRFGNMIYIGEFSNGLREGFGRWFGLDGRWFSEGQWRDDAPNGQFRANNDGVIAYTGNVVNGLWHGPVVHTFYHGYSYTPSFDMGRVVVLYFEELMNGFTFAIVCNCCRHSWGDELLDFLYGIVGFTN